MSRNEWTLARGQHGRAAGRDIADDVDENAVMFLLDLIAGPSWMREAACRGMSLDFFYPSQYGTDYANTETAKAVCRSCKVRETCLEWALEINDQHGLLGGTTERQRRQIRRNRRNAA